MFDFPPRLTQLLHKYNRTPVFVPDTYVIRDDHWVERLILKILRSRGSLQPHTYTVETISYEKLQSKELLSSIAEALDQYWERGSQGMPTIVMGNDIFRKMTGNPDVQHTLEYRAGPFKYPGDITVYGVTVRVLPHLEGWAII